MNIFGGAKLFALIHTYKKKIEVLEVNNTKVDENLKVGKNRCDKLVRFICFQVKFRLLLITMSGQVTSRSEKLFW